MLCIIMLNVTHKTFMLCVIRLDVVMLSVMAKSLLKRDKHSSLLRPFVNYSLKKC
jgi:hypothetical protein